MKTKLVRENINFERGRDPKAALGVGMINRIPHLLLKADLESGYGFNGKPGAIRNIEIVGPVRIQINFHYRVQIKNLETDKIISGEKYAKLLAEQAGVWDLFGNFYNVHHSSYEFYYTLLPEYANILQKGAVYDYSDINESLNFERGQDPKKSMGIGHQAQIEKLAREIDWDWTPDQSDEEYAMSASEEVIDVVHFLVEWDKNIYIKVSKLINRTPIKKGYPPYFAVNNIGEPYHHDPEFFNTPEEALANEEKFLKEYDAKY